MGHPLSSRSTSHRGSRLCHLLVLLVCSATVCAGFKVSTREYKFPATVDTEVLSSTSTEVWAVVYRPKADGPFPLIVFLHGNHATCGRFLASGIRRDDDSSYTFTGECPPNYVVVPNHRGYKFVGRPLAKLGYIVVSINANRGINANSGDSPDFGLNLARGRLILRHLSLLSQWNSGSEATPGSLGRSLEGQIDFSRVGLMGHSRGGEGVRAALREYRRKNSIWPAQIGPVGFKGAFEVAPVDGQTSFTLNAKGLASIILLPTCDGDVSDLQGMRVFDRVFQDFKDAVEKPRGTFTVHGANHNSFNTEWQESDSFGCAGVARIFKDAGPSPEQQRILKVTLIKFMKAHVGGSTGPERIFDPAYSLPSRLTDLTFYERGHLRAPPGAEVKVLQSFANNFPESDEGFTNTAVGVEVVHNFAVLLGLFEHEDGMRAARVTWDGPGPRYYEVVVGKGAGADFSQVQAISFRIAIGCSPGVCSGKIDGDPDTDVRVALINRNGKQSSSVRLNDFVPLRRPTGTQGNLHDALETVDLPLSAFEGISLNVVRAIRFIFKSRTGSISLGYITTDTQPYTNINSRVLANQREATGPTPRLSAKQDAAPPTVISSGNAAVSVARVGDTYEVTFTSTTSFPVTNSLPKLTVGSYVSQMGVVSAQTKSVKFMLTAGDFESLPRNVPLSVK
eukprot:CAMPEP_0198333410 /NCGR_PEP_ID=MMETSP1450-20131203/18935_1 /TAXON_ID=753684 ORGANISM="Madagascaria erythrocladiodes, Strain CCMP3234" /NCGR_SAMPLE_ID=MMETSP1450 /ASSEMBLY_ACC=CAM_ASM_001115 /LENGTH=677 /DNA_ID=CAMNT_0044037923 /DNA_START=48 /DNA_END=2078 /DNA_ORIENTATION=-